MKLKKIIPIFQWLPNYKKSGLKTDIIAGITVATVLIPQGIAYALIAGLPPIYGLYAALVPQLIYAIFGSSRQVAIGPVAMDSLIVATGVSTLALMGSESYIAIAILLALMVGSIQFLMGVFRLGFIVNFLSRPVIIGFTSAVALIIGLNQFRNLLGVNFLQSDQVQLLLEDIIYKIADFKIATTIIGVIACLIIMILRKINKKIPNALIVVTLGIITLRFFGNYLTDVAIVKDIPSGLPTLIIPVIDLALIRELLPIAATLVMVGYLEIISIGKTLEAKQDEYRIQPNQELIALGLSNIAGSFFQSYPITSSFSRSAINEEAGGKTGVSAIVSALIVVLTLLFFTPVFYHLPKTILAAIIIVAVFNLINVSEAKKLWKSNNLDFWLLIATFLSTIFFGIEPGILIGVVLSLVVLIYRTSRPYVAELGKVPNSDFYRNKSRFEEVITDKEVLVFRFDAQLFYANCTYFRDKLDEISEEKGSALKLIVLDAESINRVDSTGVEMLKERIRYYHKRDIAFYFAGVKGPVRDALFRGGVLEVVSLDYFFMRANGAVHFFKTGNNENQKKYAQYIHQAYK
ncbi:solute carrier family 26 protein [Tenacibaculum finnmarkense genomovar finnmarkense]|uniref:SulP family inorganic anion transporter n=1 Tax=Tenacibaculum finnmarkense TaxID=2781243 RepID=UPI001E5B5731|nr:solute carrier family 26 protein [Tenacibaculum finnmarkense]MCD8417168.1 solute carrier family 26 protein [Tenacibaculum finnmarkense genomovar finnmarkense]MCD8446402.1 solute carrier family 26 protein [Tenacibaculum finnmarkense genomovar finnmarkense]MCG8185551.1 solute carrier family 26 protein [Tenacibaculum finnmarkense genomovar finnmarkense]MCG8202099.1 solute carrier family 26 protein [Tenacibaculum finnmarkense genomovar finnmarkense]MCG8209613.1 solute carrier family 26 protein 